MRSFICFMVLVCLTSTLAAPAVPTTKPATTSAPMIHPTQPTQQLTANLSPQSPFIAKLNTLASYIYNGLDFIADGQSNLTVGQKSNQMLTKVALDGLKLEQALVKKDLRSFYEVLKWQQKGSFDVIKWNLKTAFEDVKLNFNQVLSEQRSLKSDNAAGLDGLKVDTGALITGQGNLTSGQSDLRSGQIGQKSDIAAVKAQLNELKIENEALKSHFQHELNNLKSEHKAELNALKNELKTALNSTQGQQQSDNVAIKAEIQTGLKDLKDLVKTIPWCDVGWIYFSNRCYQFVYKDTRRDIARGECTKVGAELITVRSKKHNDFFVKQMYQNNNKNTQLWIGIRRQNNKWTWVDGTVIGDRYSKFDSGQPSTSRGDCVSIYRGNGYWYSYSCSNSFIYACEKSRDTSV